MFQDKLSTRCKLGIVIAGVLGFQSLNALAFDPPPPPDGPPAPVLSSIAVTGPASIDEESSGQYACIATYSDGSTATVAADWSEASAYATIDTAGLLTAGNVTSDQSDTVTATYGGKTATMSVTIFYVAPTLGSLTVSGPSSVDEETTAQFGCTANWSDGTATTVVPTWSENSSYTTINASGVLTAGNVTANQSVTVTASYGGKSATKPVTIQYVAPTLNSISISGPSSVNEETTAQYSCTASWSDGTTTTVSPTWSENSSYTTINASGVLTAGNVTANQSVTVTASYNGKSATKPVTIQYVAPSLNSISITGSSSVNEGSTAQYSCTASWSDGTTTTVVPTWSENSSYTTINASGVLTAGNVTANQSVTITASYNGKSATKPVTIQYVAPTLNSISITGSSSVNEETTAQYSCTASWSDGTTTTVSPTWSENSSYATISASGLLTAGDVTADQSVTVTANYSGKSATKPVTIKYVVPTLNSITISGPTSLDEETTAQYSCTATWSDGTTTTVTPTWSENSSYATINASGVLSAGNVSSDKSVTITASYIGKSDTHGVTILYVAPPVVITGISISGPSELDENSTAGYTCTASYSDGTTAQVTPTWSENATFATISSDGMLRVGNIEADATVTVAASIGGFNASQSVAVWMVGPRVVYPLTGFDGKLVRARLWDAVTEQLTDLGEMDSPTELIIENLNANQWYWIVLDEYDEITGEWVRVHANWINM